MDGRKHCRVRSGCALASFRFISLHPPPLKNATKFSNLNVTITWAPSSHLKVSRVCRLMARTEVELSKKMCPLLILLRQLGRLYNRTHLMASSPVFAVQTYRLCVGPSSKQAPPRSLWTERQGRNYPSLPGLTLASFASWPGLE